MAKNILRREALRFVVLTWDYSTKTGSVDILPTQSVDIAWPQKPQLCCLESVPFRIFGRVGVVCRLQGVRQREAVVMVCCRCIDVSTCMLFLELEAIVACFTVGSTVVDLVVQVEYQCVCSEVLALLVGYFVVCVLAPLCYYVVMLSVGCTVWGRVLLTSLADYSDYSREKSGVGCICVRCVTDVVFVRLKIVITCPFMQRDAATLGVTS